MFGFFLTLLIIDALLLSVVVLLQAGQGGGLASLGGSGGTETFVGGRQAATFLTRSTWWLGGAFLFLALLLTVVSSRRATGTTDVQELLRQSQTQSEAPVAPAPLGGTPVQTAPATGGEASPAAPLSYCLRTGPGIRVLWTVPTRRRMARWFSPRIFPDIRRPSRIRATSARSW